VLDFLPIRMLPAGRSSETRAISALCRGRSALVLHSSRPRVQRQCTGSCLGTHRSSTRRTRTQRERTSDQSTLRPTLAAPHRPAQPSHLHALDSYNNVTYCQQIARQHSCHKNIGQERGRGRSSRTFSSHLVW